MNPTILEEFKRTSPDFQIRIVDVGARSGFQEKWNSLASYAQFIGFEPDEDEFAALSSRASKTENLFFLNTALHSHEGKREFHLLRGRQASSLLFPNRVMIERFPEPERFEIEKTVALKVDSMDNVLRANNIEDVDFIKLDTQGTELSILEGATNTLRDVFGVEIEVEFLKLYEDQPLFCEVDEFLKKQDFELFDLRPNYWKRKSGMDLGGIKGQLVFADALYLKGVDGTLLQRRATTTKMLKAISLCLFLGYFDYGIEIAERAKKNGLITDGVMAVIRAYAQNNTNRPPSFRGRGRLLNLLYNVLGWLDPCCKLGLHQIGGWSASGNVLANRE